ncbi:hypothetical protein PsorP6_003175 [Peronosclerospora sorghi]|uniref:Uncharacterized protein n=1 Tax=Peronosclerospora sorghi TaxID=230839 RepID=A0ACC0VMF7_9STRA|nr:hypothetical protein PsorP6_003175 [Peronosclerospora sorghi]
MIVIAKSSLALLLVTATVSNGFSQAANLRERDLRGVTITTNINTYTSYDDYAVLMLAAVNKQRATQGLAPLCLNRKLHAAAQRHSNDMAAKDFMGHGGSDGSTMSERISEAGYEWSSVAENVAAGQINVADVMESWIHSPGHLANIMGDYTMFGSAYAFNKHGEYQHYWTQEFGSSETEQCDSSEPVKLKGASDYIHQKIQPVTDALPTKALAPVIEQFAPATKAPAAPIEQYAPVLKALAPVIKQDAPATKAPAPVTEQDAPATKAPAPVIEQDAPATKAPTAQAPAIYYNPPIETRFVHKSCA